MKIIYNPEIKRFSTDHEIVYLVKYVQYHETHTKSFKDKDAAFEFAEVMYPDSRVYQVPIDKKEWVARELRNLNRYNIDRVYDQFKAAGVKVIG